MQVDDSFLKLSPEDQNSTVEDIARSLGTGPSAGPAAAPDIGNNRASLVAAGRGLPVGGAWMDEATAALNAAAQPITETGMSHAPTYSQRKAENLARITPAVNQYEKENPIGTTIGKVAIGSAPFAAAGAVPAAARVLGMTGTLPQMIRGGLQSGAVIGGADAAARGEDIGKGIIEGGVTGGALPVAGNVIGRAARGVRNLVSSLPRAPHTVDLNGNSVTVPQSHVNPDNEIGSEEQAAISGALNPAAQREAQAANEATHAQTSAAAENFGNEMRGGPGPAQPPADKPTAANQTITDLAQQHNDQIQAQARHDAQIAAEGTAVRSNLAAPLGTPEPAQPRSTIDAVGDVQGALQQRAQAARQGVTQAYNTVGRMPGEYTPGAWDPVGQSVRNQIARGAQAQGVRPVTVNQGLTPHSQAMMDVVDNRLGMNYAPNAMARGDMIRMPDGRVVPRPLTPADVEAARQEMVGHLQDARNAARAPGGSGTDAYAAQRIMDAFDAHHRAILSTPGAFSGDGAAYQAAIDAARAAHSQRRATFSNQGNGDTVGPVIERMVGRRADQPMPPGQMANSLYGTPTSPGGGNSQAITQRVLNIVGENSPTHQIMKEGLVNHLTGVPEGAPPLAPAAQANRLQAYLATPHAQTLLNPNDIARLHAHAADLRAQAQPAAATTAVQRQVDRLAAEGGAQHVIDKVFSSNGAIKAGSGAILQEIQNRVSQPTWNSIRQAMWEHLREKPEGLVNWGPRELSNRIARFLDSEAAPALYDARELGVLRQFQEHYAKLAPLPNTTNSSGSAVMASKLVQQFGNHFGAMIGSTVGGALGGPFIGHAAGAAVGEAAQRAAKAVRAAKQVERTRELFLGKKGSHPLNQNYSRAAAVISHAATPLTNDGQ